MIRLFRETNMRRSLRPLKLGVLLTIILLPGIAVGFLGWGDPTIGVQIKMLAETIQQTLHLKEILAFTKKEVSDINNTLRIVKDVNRDINEVRHYNLDRFEDDVRDITVGGTSDEIDDLSSYISDKRFIDGRDSGRIRNFIRYVWGEEPDELDSPIKVKLAANNRFAVRSFEDVNESYDFTYNVRKLYKNVIDDAKDASPGQAEQIGAKLQAVNTLQLSKMQDQQAGLLRLQAMDVMNHAQEAEEAQQQTIYLFGGIADTFEDMKQEQKR